VPNWTALFVPAGTDAAIAAYWSNALQRVLADPTFQAELRGFSAAPVTSDKAVPLEVELSLKVGLEVAR
jgi:tripartite-type tricarboxylate transporter receptor subunit TctC